MHGAKAAPSSEHSKVAPGSFETNSKLASASVDRISGTTLTEVCGGVVSASCTVQVWASGSGSTLPAASIALTPKVCSPAARPVYSLGELQPAYAPPSSEHSKVTFCSPEANRKVADVLWVVAAGLSMMSEPGGVVSTDQLCTAGDRSVLPAASMARTRNSCGAAVSPEYCLGDVHGLYGAPSSEHSKVGPVSSAEKPKLAEVLPLGAPGPESIVVCGAVPSYVQVWVAGVWSTLPVLSIARTESVR